MTNKEAINLLDNLIGMVEDNQNSDYDKALKMAIDALKQTERKKGKWRTVTKKSNLFDAYRCSECNGLVYGKTNFCPYCGCKMER